MSDEQTVTPDPGNSTEAQENWEQRFKDTQGAYTKSQQELQDERKVWEDEQVALQRLADKFPHLFEDEEDDEPEFEDEPDENEQPMTRAEFKAWQAEQAQEQAQQQGQAMFEADMQKFAGDRELSKWAEQSIRYRADQGEFAGAQGPEKLKAAIDEWFAEQEALAPKSRPRVPHTPTNGQAGTGVPDWSGMKRQEIDKYLAEKAQGMLQG